MESNTMYAYFVYDKHSKHTKIGKTINIQERIATLKIGNPHLRLIYYTDKHSESYYHNMFVGKRVTGEWFNLGVSDYRVAVDKKLKLPKALFYTKHEKYIKQKPIIDVNNKIKEVEIDGYYFLNHDCLFWHSGKFWFNETEVKQVYNNGSLSILLHGSQKFGIKKLRKFARKCRIKIFTEPMPF